MFPVCCFMLLAIDLGFFSFFFCNDQGLDEDVILYSSDEDSSDGSRSSNKCKVKNPEKVTGIVDKNRLATGYHALPHISFANSF